MSLISSSFVSVRQHGNIGRREVLKSDRRKPRFDQKVCRCGDVLQPFHHVQKTCASGSRHQGCEVMRVLRIPRNSGMELL